MSDNQENKALKKENNWWLTLPGILTGLAAILTAIGGLITVLYQVDILPLPQPTPTPSTPPIPSPSLQPTSTPDPVPTADQTEPSLLVTPTSSNTTFENDFMVMELTRAALDGNSVRLAFTIRRKDQDFYVANYSSGNHLIMDGFGTPLCRNPNDYLLQGLKIVSSSSAVRSQEEGYTLIDSSNPALRVSWSSDQSSWCREMNSSTDVVSASFELVRLEISETSSAATMSRFPVSFPEIDIPQ